MSLWSRLGFQLPVEDRFFSCSYTRHSFHSMIVHPWKRLTFPPALASLFFSNCVSFSVKFLTEKKKMCWWFKTKIYSSLGWIVWHLVSSLCRKKKKINHFWKVWMSGCRDGSAVKSAISLAEHSTLVLSTCTGWLRLPVISALGHLAPSPGFCRHLQPHVH